MSKKDTDVRLEHLECEWAAGAEPDAVQTVLLAAKSMDAHTKSDAKMDAKDQAAAKVPLTGAGADYKTVTLIAHPKITWSDDGSHAA